METPSEDAAEQDRPATADGDGPGAVPLPELPLEVNEADAAEQTRDVGYDDEDYR
jgi:hypothetical protein